MMLIVRGSKRIILLLYKSMSSKYTAVDNELLKSIGRNIRSYRKKVNISQEELAYLAGIDRSYLGSVERGERNVSAINIKKIAEALKLKAGCLLR
ncbi:MAG: helix-turn-helix transcriptional regulator [Candidatus Omnitrophota bacterium]